MLNDFRYSCRMLLKSPGFTTVAVLTLALGIGANTTIFSALNALVFRPLPYRNPDELVWVFATHLQLGYPRLPPNWANELFSDLLRTSQSFAQSARIKAKDFILDSNRGGEQVRGMRASWNLFELLGVQSVLGRSFRAEENEWGRHHVVLLSHEFWRRRFGGDPGILGQTIQLIDTEVSDRTGSPHDTLVPQSYTVIGVLPPGWQFPLAAGDFNFRAGELNFRKAAEIWEPESLNPDERKARYVLDLILARLKPSVTFEQAQSETQNLFQHIQREFEGQHPNEMRGYGVELLPLKKQVAGSAQSALLLLLGATLLVLLIACVNVANLLLARATGRQKEFAIRTALGARRLHLVRQLLIETLVLAFCGGFLGLSLALLGTHGLRVLSFASLPRVEEISLDWRVLAFAAILVLSTALAFGLVPALRASRCELNESLKEGGRISTEGRHNRARSVLVVGEIALCITLLLGAGLLLRSFVGLLQVDPGYEPEHLLTAQLPLLHPKYGPNAGGTFAEQLSTKHSPDPQGRFVRQLLERLDSLPGVQSAAVASWIPIEGGRDRFEAAFQIEGRPIVEAGSLDHLTVSRMSFVTNNYFKTMGIPILRGRDFTPQDLSPDTPAVRIVSESFVRKYFPNEDPIGKRIRFSKGWGEVVGVVKDTLESGLDTQAEPQLYHAGVTGLRGLSIVVRAGGEPDRLVAAIRREVLASDMDQPVPNVRLMKQILSDSLAERRFQMLLLGVFAVLALVLASVGIYGLMRYTVAQRTHEFGVRMALGAQTSDVLKLVLLQGMRLVLIGLLVGLAWASALTQILSSQLYGITVTDPATFMGVSTLLIVVTLLACYFPARRATKVDPLVALRYE
jgi:predicted permease